MKLLDIHSEVVKAVEEILGPMRDFDIDKDEDVADFSMDTAIGSVINFDKYGENLFIGYMDEDSDGPVYVFLTLLQKSADVGYYEYLTKDQTAYIDEDTYTEDDLKFAVELAKEYAQSLAKDFITREDDYER